MSEAENRQRRRQWLGMAYKFYANKLHWIGCERLDFIDKEGREF